MLCSMFHHVYWPFPQEVDLSLFHQSHSPLSSHDSEASQSERFASLEVTHLCEFTLFQVSEMDFEGREVLSGWRIWGWSEH